MPGAAVWVCSTLHNATHSEFLTGVCDDDAREWSSSPVMHVSAGRCVWRGPRLGDGFLVRLVDVHEEWLAALGVLLEA